MRFKELERIIKKDGWYLDSSNGSHMHYKHREKKGKSRYPSIPATSIRKPSNLSYR